MKQIVKGNSLLLKIDSIRYPFIISSNVLFGVGVPLAKNNFSSAFDFVLNAKCANPDRGLNAVSLFSGGGLSDLGYQEAGFKFVAQLELDPSRASLCQKNFPNSKVFIGDIKKKRTELMNYLSKFGDVDLMSLTPPCQGMSSSNPGRGKASDPHSSDERNTLLLEALPIIKSLKPKIVIVENVPQLFNRMVKYKKKSGKLLAIFSEGIDKNYTIVTAIVQMADFGVPQDRKRAVLVAIRKDQGFSDKLINNPASALPIPSYAKLKTNNSLPWITLSSWLTMMGYPQLDAKTKEASCDKSDSLHIVPAYPADRYNMILDIPPNSGKNAYQNSTCHSCGKTDVLEGRIYCPKCKKPMLNRPFVKTRGRFRLIKGFASSYRRMHPDRPSATITTASSHIGSDYKIHPWENRVLSMRECADLQTLPRKYDFSLAFQLNKKYLIRQVIGEALPPWFTYQHGLILKQLLNDSS
jgi:DNA (cytosine-5)-methyltransferase 1